MKTFAYPIFALSLLFASQAHAEEICYKSQRAGAAHRGPRIPGVDMNAAERSRLEGIGCKNIRIMGDFFFADCPAACDAKDAGGGHDEEDEANE